jgi:hypothetical protein
MVTLALVQMVLFLWSRRVSLRSLSRTVMGQGRLWPAGQSKAELAATDHHAMTAH